MNLVQILQGANVGLRILQARLVLVIVTVMGFILFAAAMWLQTTLGAMIAATWGLLFFLPVLLTGRGGHDGSPKRQPERAEDEPPVRATEPA